MALQYEPTLIQKLKATDKRFRCVFPRTFQVEPGKQLKTAPQSAQSTCYMTRFVQLSLRLASSYNPVDFVQRHTRARATLRAAGALRGTADRSDIRKASD